MRLPGRSPQTGDLNREVSNSDSNIGGGLWARMRELCQPAVLDGSSTTGFNLG